MEAKTRWVLVSEYFKNQEVHTYFKTRRELRLHKKATLNSKYPAKPFSCKAYKLTEYNGKHIVSIKERVY